MQILVHTVTDLRWFDLMFLTLPWCESDKRSIGTVLLILVFESLVFGSLDPGLAICGTLFSPDTGRGQRAAASSQPWHQEAEQPIR